MRLGVQPCEIKQGSRADECYALAEISERHRHRYEFNPEYRGQFALAGMLATGTSPDGNLVEIAEVPDHPWYVAVQFHPEFKSKPAAPHPLFRGFVEAALERHHERIQLPI